MTDACIGNVINSNYTCITHYEDAGFRSEFSALVDAKIFTQDEFCAKQMNTTLAFVSYNSLVDEYFCEDKEPCKVDTAGYTVPDETQICDPAYIGDRINKDLFCGTQKFCADNADSCYGNVVNVNKTCGSSFNDPSLSAAWTVAYPEKSLAEFCDVVKNETETYNYTLSY